LTCFLEPRHATLEAMLRMVVHTEADLLAGVLHPAFLSSQVQYSSYPSQPAFQARARTAVLRIRILRTHMFLDLPDPHPDP
jgi:hypothetical protein